METTEHPHPPEPGKTKGRTQVISIIVGAGLFILGLSGILFPAFAGLHFSPLTSTIIAVAGGTLLYNGGFKDNSLYAFFACLGFGAYFGILALLGFILGEPGMPTVGYLRMDPHLLRIIPNVLELGWMDQVLYAILAVILLAGAFDWRMQNKRRATPYKSHHPRDRYQREHNKYAHR